MTSESTRIISQCIHDLQTNYPGKFYEFKLKKKNFDEDFIYLWNRNNPDGLEVWKFIQSKLFQFRLSAAYEVRDILTLTYTRSVKALVDGKSIYSVKPWTKSTSYNTIRELRRERDKVQRRDQREIVDISISDSSLDEEDSCLHSKLKDLKEYLLNLTDFERKVLELGADSSIAWKEARIILERDGFPHKSEAALRKTYQRLREKLKDELSN